MKITGDQNLIKRMNKSLVLDTVISQAPVSRAEISVKIGLNKASVSSLVTEWLDEELVIETGLGESSGGRKPVMLLFNSRAGYAVGVDLGVNYISAVLTDLSGRTVQQSHLRLNTSQPDDVFERVVHAVRSLITHAPAAPYGIIGIGVGVPGIVDEDGIVLTAPNFGWHEVRLRQKLEEALDLPVTIDNEANAGAIGEHMYGIGQSYSNLVYISAGVGIGTGLMVNGSIFRGASGFSGELGHMTIQADQGKLCSCGNTGCWEMYASENALLHLASQSKEAKEDFESLLALAAADDALAITAFQDIGRYMGIGIATIINAFNPEVIIIGNRLGQARQWLEDPMLASVSRSSLQHHLERSAIEFASLGLDSAAYGAASMAISRFLASAKAGEAVKAVQAVDES